VNTAGKGELHDTRNEDTGLVAFQENIRQWLNERVGDEENGQCRIVKASGKRNSMSAKTLLETIDLRITYVGTIEECEQV
jgi:hypothetical protein